MLEVVVLFIVVVIIVCYYEHFKYRWLVGMVVVIVPEGLVMEGWVEVLVVEVVGSDDSNQKVVIIMNF